VARRSRLLGAWHAWTACVWSAHRSLHMSLSRCGKSAANRLRICGRGAVPAKPGFVRCATPGVGMSWFDSPISAAEPRTTALDSALDSALPKVQVALQTHNGDLPQTTSQGTLEPWPQAHEAWLKEPMKAGPEPPVKTPKGLLGQRLVRQCTPQEESQPKLLDSALTLLTATSRNRA
jgi:hypothetical protein